MSDKYTKTTADVYNNNKKTYDARKKETNQNYETNIVYNIKCHGVVLLVASCDKEL